MDMRKFSDGARVHVLGAPKLSLGRALIVLATVGGAMAPGVASASNVFVHDSSGVSRVRVVDAGLRAAPVRGASLAASRPVRMAMADPVRDTGGDMARSLMDLVGGGDSEGSDVGRESRMPAPVPQRDSYRPSERSPDRVDAPGRSAGYSGPDADGPVREMIPLQVRAPISVVAPEGHVFKEMPDAELGRDGETLDGVAVRPGERTPAQRFNAPYHPGEPAPNPPASRFGVDYTWSPLLHEHRDAKGDLEIIEGGFTTHKGSVSKTYLPSIPDPSDAFMNIGVQAVMQNTGKDFDQSVAMMESSLAKAKDCVQHFGRDHACSASAGGVTFDYGNSVFTIRVRPMEDLSAKTDMMPGYGRVVAFETQQGLFPGPAFRRAATAEPEEGMAP